MPYTVERQLPMEKNGKHLDLDAIADAEVFGALAVSSSRRFRGARMTKYGKTTAQLRVLRSSARRVFAMLRQVGAKRPLHIGKATLELTKHGRGETLAVRGL